MRRENRIRSTRDFKRVFTEGRRASAPGVIAFALSRGEGPARVGVTAGRRVGSAVHRNRAKRLLREAARRALVGLASGTDVVLLATPEINGKDFHFVLEQVQGLVKKVQA